MVFSSFVFLCFFMPITLALYALAPANMRNGWLFFVSLLFYAWGEPVYILIMLFSTVFDYTNGRLIERGWHPKAVLLTSIVGNLAILTFFKYTDFAISGWNLLTGSHTGLLHIALPIGISFYTFQTMSYTIDVYRGRVNAQHNIIDFGMYVCMFPQLIAGPIVRYSEIEGAMGFAHRKMVAKDFFWGMFRFTLGLSKKVLLANQIGMLWDEVKGMHQLSADLAWLGALAFAFHIYFDFSGYSDMAIGLGRMLGFPFPENFHYPYEANSITDFWRRWHMTLSGWFKEYVYIPLGGNRKGLPRQIGNLFIVWTLTGLWHGACVNYVLWGLYYFVFLCMEKLFLGSFLKRLPEIFGHIYALFVILLGWVIFACEDLQLLGHYILGLFGGYGCFSDYSLYLLREYGLLLVILILASTHFPKKCVTHLLGEEEKIKEVTGLVWMLLLYGLSFVFLVGSSYNPFLYFRF